MATRRTFAALRAAAKSRRFLAMTISFNWLKTLFPTTLSAAEIGALLTNSGLEVESLTEVESIPGGLRGVVLGTVLTLALVRWLTAYFARHPRAWYGWRLRGRRLVRE